MNTWLDAIVIFGAVLASGVYLVYALGPKRIRDAYTRFATKHFGLRALRWFTPSKHGHSCRDCPSSTTAPNSAAPGKRI
jgi:hypothetical protein